MRGFFAYLTHYTKRYDGLNPSDLTGKLGLGKACYDAMRRLQRRAHSSSAQGAQSIGGADDAEAADNASN